MVKDLIMQYQQGRDELQDEIKKLQGRIRCMVDLGADVDSLKRDLSLLNGMARDMSEAIQMMKSHTHISRGQGKIMLMDPYIMSQLQLQVNTDDPEDHERDRWIQILQDKIQERMQLLTTKQRSTIHRWLFEGKTISQIAREDFVARQCVHQRIYGSKTHPGALGKLRDGK